MDTIPWVEKYRPRCISQIVYQDAVKKTLKTIVETKNMPHCLFYGPPGTGKTSAAFALCMELFGEALFKKRVLELNASDDRGINVIREKVKSWSRLLTEVANGNSPEWKIIILDEADMMTFDAQSALRRVMEDHVRTTRFIIICNYLTKIIDPINSRCAKYCFEQVEKHAQVERLMSIASKENITLPLEVANELHLISRGDLRSSITFLQISAAVNKTVTVDIVREVAGIPPPNITQNLLKNALTSNDLLFLNDFMAENWDIHQIMLQLLYNILSNEDLPDSFKATIIAVLAEAESRLTQGASELIELQHVIVTIMVESKRLKGN